MFISLPIEQLDASKVIYNDPVPNLIMTNSSFVKMIYTTNDFSTNGIFIQLMMSNVEVKKFQNGDLTKLIFAEEKWIETLRNIEEQILEQYDIMMKKGLNIRLLQRDKIQIVNKNPVYKLKQHLERRSIKLPNEYKEGYYDRFMMLVKLSGIWIGSTEYGITYKFIPVKQMNMVDYH